MKQNFKKKSSVIKFWHSHSYNYGFLCTWIICTKQTMEPPFSFLITILISCWLHCRVNLRTVARVFAVHLSQLKAAVSHCLTLISRISTALSFPWNFILEVKSQGNKKNLNFNSLRYESISSYLLCTSCFKWRRRDAEKRIKSPLNF